MSQTNGETVKFKKFSKKAIRKRRDSDEEQEEGNDDEHVLSKLEETKELQKLRLRPHGVSADALASGRQIVEEESSANDPFKTATGGMADMKSIKSGKNTNTVDDAYDTGIGTQFSVETNTRDEDAEM